MLSDGGRQPNGLAFYGDRLFYADSAFDSIEVATINGDSQPPQWTHFKKDVENLANIKALQPRACKYFSLFLFLENSKWNILASSGHPCHINNGNCDHICIPLMFAQRTCTCANGYVKDGQTSCKLFDESFVIVATKTKVIGYP